MKDTIGDLEDRIAELEDLINEQNIVIELLMMPPKERFEVFYKRLHPQWPERRGTKVDTAIWMNSLDS